MLNKLNWKKIVIGITVGVAVSSLTLISRSQRLLEQIELLSYDALIRFNAESGFDERITIIGIDDNTLRQLNSDKLSDRTLQEVLTIVARYQPRVIGVDIIRDIPIGEGREELIDYVNELYQPLEAAVKPIIFPCALPSPTKPEGIAPPPVIDPDSAVGFVDLETDPQNIFGGELIRRTFISSIPVNTSTNSSEGQFGVEPTQSVCNAPFSFGFLTALSYLQARQVAQSSPGTSPNLTEIIDLAEITEGEIEVNSFTYTPLKEKLGSYHNLDSGVYQHLIDYRYTQPGAIISLSKVLQQEVSPEQFRDRVVLIGYVTKEDIHQTPFGLRPGVFVHGWIVSQILRNVIDRQELIWSLSEPVEWLWIIGWGVAGSIVALGIRPLGLFVGSHLITIAVIGGSCWLLFTQQGWIPLIPPILSFTMASVAVRVIAPKLELDRLKTVPLQNREKTSPQPTYVESEVIPPQPTYVEPEVILPQPTYVEPKANTPQPTYVEPKAKNSNRPSFVRKDPSIGKDIGDRYTLEKLLGQGGMSKVYLALDRKLNNKKVAIKIMTSYFSANNQHLIKRFMGEVKSLCVLNHPNIIQITDYGLTPQEAPFFGYPFYVMEYFVGQTLQQLLDRKEWLTTDLVLKIAIKVCQGLKEAHNKGIIHRDLKPDNIFLISEGEVVKVIDFGIAKKIDEESQQHTQLTVAGTFIGTYRYASPEQCRGADIDSRTDLYSLGVVLYEALSQRNPYNISEDSGTTKADWIASHLRENPKPLREQSGCQDITVELENAIMKCLAKLPQKRFQTIEELELVLKSFVSQKN